MKKNDFTTVKITDVTGLGYGVAHADGMTVFVDGGVTGDIMKVKIIKITDDPIENFVSPRTFNRALPATVRTPVAAKFDPSSSSRVTIPTEALSLTVTSP